MPWKQKRPGADPTVIIGTILFILFVLTLLGYAIYDALTYP